MLHFHSASLKDTGYVLYHFFHKMSALKVVWRPHYEFQHCLRTYALSIFFYSIREVEHCQHLTDLLGNILIWTVIFHWENIPHFMTLSIKSSLEHYYGI